MTAMTTCHACEGSALCNSCEGSGWTTHADASQKLCGMCFGSGGCRACKAQYGGVEAETNSQRKFTELLWLALQT